MTAPLCRNGLHAMTDSNIFLDRGQKECKACRAARRAAYKKRRADVAARLLRDQREREALERSDTWHAQDARTTLPRLGFSHLEMLAYIRAKGWRTAPPQAAGDAE